MSNRSLYLLTPSTLLRAYAAGIFPMAESGEASGVHWFDPPVRAIIPLDAFHISTSLKRAIRQKPFTIKLDTDFNKVIRACAEPAPGRTTTWINSEIIGLYTALHWRGHAHSIEAWDGNELVGGLYGVSLGGAFFGESMFSRKTNASKIVLVYLATLLRYCGFTLMDTQFLTSHLAQFGTHEVTRANYHHLLRAAIKIKTRLALPSTPDWDHLVGGFLQPISQIS
jgi:leucyl/phenylalanyl-tRNA--protein transferase